MCRKRQAKGHSLNCCWRFSCFSVQRQHFISHFFVGHTDVMMLVFTKMTCGTTAWSVTYTVKLGCQAYLGSVGKS